MRLYAARFAAVLAPVALFPLFAQQLDKPATAVPQLIRVTGSFHPANGLPIGPTESATLSIYAEQQGGQPLWQETQNVAIDASGQYTAMLGATQTDGVSVDLFSANEPRWLEVQFNRPGETDQPRVQLVSVPYALKASDAETLGGRPASAYLLDPNAVASAGAVSGTNAASNTPPTSLPNSKSLKPRSISGGMNYVPYFTDNNNDLGNSVLYQSGGNMGIGTTTPAFPLTIGGTYRALGNAVAIPNVASYASFDSAGNPRSLFWIDNNNPDIIHIRNNQRGVGGTISLESRAGGISSLTILNTGNVGIGTTAPAYPLSIGGTYSTLGNAIAIPNNSSFAGFDSSGGPRSFFWMDNSNPDILHVRNNQRGVGGTISFESQAAGAASLTILNNGNVGIGTPTPGSKLDVAGSINFDGVLSDQGMPVLQFGSNGNMAVGAGALTGNTTGSTNTAIGEHALSSNTSGFANTATGPGALQNNTTGDHNTAMGAALLSNSTGNFNAAMGDFALEQNTTGSNNIAIGAYALELASTVNSNIAIGYSAAANLSGGSNNIAIGSNAAAFVYGSPSNNIHIGTLGGFADNGTIRIGGNTNLGDPAAQSQFFVSGVRGITTGNNDAVPVLIDSAGQLGTANSSRRFKEDIQDMGDASKGLMRLRAVTFRYQKPFADGSKPIQYGLIAEEVAEVYPDLVAHSADGQIETVKYQVLDSMLLNEVQRQEKVIRAQAEQIESLEDRLSRLEAAIAAGSR